MNEKAIIADIQRACMHDGPGIRTTVFLKGCPLKCLWCHNPETISAKPQLFFHYDQCTCCGECARVCTQKVHLVEKNNHIINFEACQSCGKCIEACNFNALKMVGKEMTVDEVLSEVMADIDFYQNSGGGITLSGGEPLYQYAFAKELLKRCKASGINTCVETSGFVSPFKFTQLLPLMDVLLFDYKITGSERHKIYTGVPDQVVLENLHAAYRYGISIYLRCPVIPDINDTDEHFKAIAALAAQYPKLKGIEILSYHDIGNSKRISIGIDETLTETKTVLPETSQEWISKMKSFGCEKAIIG